MRNSEIDIAKGILIYFVVLGHILPDSELIHKYIYWFHMPAFFIISGLFIKNQFELKSEVKKKIRRLLIPYFLFSLILGTWAREGNVVKQIVGTIIGANGNITTFTFPYYFLMVLFLSSCYFYVLRKYVHKNLGVVISFNYIGIHLINYFVPSNIMSWIPWNLDMAFYATSYLYLGNRFKGVIVNNVGGQFSLFLIIVLYFLDYAGFINYQYDFKQHAWWIFFDVLIPFMALQTIFCISKYINKVSLLTVFISYAGKGSLAILLMHPLFIWFNNIVCVNDISNCFLALINVLECLIVYWAVQRSRLTRLVFGER